MSKPVPGSHVFLSVAATAFGIGGIGPSENLAGGGIATDTDS